MFRFEILLFPCREDGNAVVDRLVQDLPASFCEDAVEASAQVVPDDSRWRRRGEVYDLEEFRLQCGLLCGCAFGGETVDMLGQIGRKCEEVEVLLL